jgi:peptidoglycan hydrolase-like protein with peptidoglycan-binding domain
MIRSRNILLAALIAIGACAGATAMLPSVAQAQGDAEIAFWNSIKDSKNAAEYQAYLQAFPNGVFAPLARIRVQQFGGSAGNQPPQAPPMQQPPRQAQPQIQPPNQPAPFQAGGIDMTNTQVVAEIQSKLYNLNYDIKRFDGVPDDSTTTSIREWQERINVQPTGILTDALLQRLRNSRTPTVWGSLAYTANGTIGRAWNRPTRLDAEEAALAECRRRAGRNAECSTQSAADSACLAAATYRATIGETVYFGARVSLKPRLQEAIDGAMQQCQAAERSQGTCQSRVSFCADGSHER